MKRRRLTVQAGLLLLWCGLLLAGCQALMDLPGRIPGLGASPTPDDPTPTRAAASPTPAAVGATDTPPALPRLVIWLPAQFDPEANNPAARALRLRLERFERDRKVEVEVRLKAVSGQGGLLDTLNAASTAAPAALPSVIALQRPDLEAAALKSLVAPLSDLGVQVDSQSYFPYARQMSLVQNTLFGLPFAGDALVMLYRPERVPSPPATWEDITRRGEPLLFAAADPQGLVTLHLYRSAGGDIEDDQGRPTLQADLLDQALLLYQNGARGGTFPSSLAQYETDAQAWQTYRDGAAPWVVSWASRYLAEPPADTTLAPLPGLTLQPYSIANGWLWAVTDPDPERRRLASELLVHLSDSAFLAEWTQASGYLPTRQAALDGWDDQSMETLLNRLVLAAEMRPRNELMASLGPALHDATVQVIRGETEAAPAAQAAAERFGAQ